MVKINVFKFVLLGLVLFLTINFVSAYSTNDLLLYLTLDDNSTSQINMANNSINGTIFGGIKPLVGSEVNNSLNWSVKNVANYILVNRTDDRWYNATRAGRLYSFSFWAYLPNYAGCSGFCTVIDKRNSSAHQEWWVVFLPSGKISITLYDEGNVMVDPQPTLNTTALNKVWHFYAITYNTSNNNVTLYVDGNYYYSSVIGINVGQADQGDIRIGRDAYAGDNGFVGVIDEIGFWNNSLSSSDVLALWNNGVGLNPFNVYSPSVSSNVSFVSQFPSNLTSTNGFPLVATFNFSNVTGINNTFINYTTSTNGNRCIEITNGSCSSLSNSYKQISNSSGFYNVNLQNFSLSDNNIYPANYNFNESVMRLTSHSVLSSSNQNNIWGIGFVNMSNSTNHNIFEVMANSTAPRNIFYCNSSYVSGQLSSNNNCVQFATLNSVNFNHSHTVYESHNVFSLPINTSSGKVGSVKVSQNGSFFIVGSNVGVMNLYYISNVSRVNQTVVSSNNGNSYSAVVGTADSHLHQFVGDESLNYSACQNKSGVFNCSSFHSDLIDETFLPPTSPQVLTPVSGQNVSQFVNISWSASIPSSNLTSINNYSLSLLNQDFSFNQSIVNVGTNLSYVWNTYNVNLSLGSYYVLVNANDSNNNFAYGISDLFNVVSNVLLNVSAFNISASNNISNFSFSIVDLSTLVYSTFNTSNGTVLVDLIKGHSYNYSFVSVGFAPIVSQYVSNQSSYQFLKLFTGPANSVNVNVFNELTGVYISQNVSLIFTNLATTQQFSYVTNSGSYLAINLSSGAYSLIVSSSSPVSYYPRYYDVDINNNYQQINSYLANTNSTVLFNVKTTGGTPISGILVEQFVNVNNSVVLVQSVLSDVSGKAQFSYIPFTYYTFVASDPNYDTNSFNLNPILFSSYDITMNPIGQGIVVPTAYVSYSPSSFFNGQSGVFNFSISSTFNGLNSYSYTVSAPGISISNSGSNANGQSFANSFSLVNVSTNQFVTLFYKYQLSNGVSYNETINFPISVPLYNNTLFTLGQNKSFGFGLGDKILIVVLINLLCFGVGFSVFGSMGGLVLVLFNTGIFVAVGFVPAFMFYITFVVAILYMFSRGVEGG